MTEAEALKTWRENKVILITGSDSSLRHRTLSAIEAVAKKHDDFGVETYFADTKPPREWFGDVGTVPGFSEYRTIIVRQLSRVEHPVNLAEAVKSVPDTGRLILVIDDESGEQDKLERHKRIGDNWTKVLSKTPALVLKQELPKKDLDLAVFTRGQEMGINIKRSAAKVLVEMLGNNVAAAFEELERLSLYAEEGKAITDQDVQAAVTPDPEYEIYRLVDAVMAKKPREAVTQFRAMMRRTKKPETEIYARLFPVLGKQLSLVWQARACVELRSSVSNPSPELASCLLSKQRLGVDDYPSKKAMTTARGVSFERLSECFVLIQRAEGGMKGMQASTSMADTIEVMLLSMCRA